MTNAKNFKLIAELAIGDCRLFEDDSHFYLADNSGYDPDRTDDGPLRLNVDLNILVSEKCCYVPVLVERFEHGTGRTSRVHVSHEGTLKLLRLLEARGFRMPVKFEPDVKGIVALVRHLTPR